MADASPYVLSGGAWVNRGGGVRVWVEGAVPTEEQRELYREALDDYNRGKS